MDYVNLEIDFIERTLKLIEQYSKFIKNNSSEECFDVTMYINCLTGLIILPRESEFLASFLPEDTLENWGIKREKIRDKRIVTIKQLVIQLRHSVAHFDIEFGSDNEKQIDKIKFKDTAENKEVIAEFDIEDFKIFVELLADTVIKNAKARNRKNE